MPGGGRGAASRGGDGTEHGLRLYAVADGPAPGGQPADPTDVPGSGLDDPASAPRGHWPVAAGQAGAGAMPAAGRKRAGGAAPGGGVEPGAGLIKVSTL